MKYDEPVTFGARGTAKTLSPVGFDFSDTVTSWTTIQHCSLEASLPIPRQDISLEIDAFPFVTDSITSQQLFVYLNGLFVGFHTFADRHLLKCPVSRSAISSRSTVLSLVIPTAVSPNSLGLSSDLRLLGLSFFSISFASK